MFFSEIVALLKPHYRNYVPIKQELKVLYVAYNRTIENKSHTKENGVHISLTPFLAVPDESRCKNKLKDACSYLSLMDTYICLMFCV